MASHDGLLTHMLTLLPGARFEAAGEVYTVVEPSASAPDINRFKNAAGDYVLARDLARLNRTGNFVRVLPRQEGETPK